MLAVVSAVSNSHCLARWAEETHTAAVRDADAVSQPGLHGTVVSAVSSEGEAHALFLVPVMGNQVACWYDWVSLTLRAAVRTCMDQKWSFSLATLDGSLYDGRHACRQLLTLSYPRQLG